MGVVKACASWHVCLVMQLGGGGAQGPMDLHSLGGMTPALGDHCPVGGDTPNLHINIDYRARRGGL